MSVCLDAYALLAWLQDESGADDVEALLVRANSEENFRCHLSVINLGEVFYRLVRLRGIEDADAFWQDVRNSAMPIQLVEATPNRVREAARLKGSYPIAFADAFAAQTARETETRLVTGGPELKLLENDGLISLFWIGVP